MMIRKDFYAKLNGILDSCGLDMPGGSNKRPFMAYSWKKNSSKNSLNLADISRFKDIRNILLKNKKWSAYLMLMCYSRG